MKFSARASLFLDAAALSRVKYANQPLGLLVFFFAQFWPFGPARNRAEQKSINLVKKKEEALTLNLRHGGELLVFVPRRATPKHWKRPIDAQWTPPL